MKITHLAADNFSVSYHSRQLLKLLFNFDLKVGSASRYFVCQSDLL